jgi:3-oxoacyl-[acyl-carrier-protein] synthase-3
MVRSVIIATGSYLPQKKLTNDDLARMVDTNDAWIRERTGITQRYVVGEGEATSDLAIHAARAALKAAGIDADAIDGIVVATSTPDTSMPSVATKVQAALGVKHGAAVDVAAACTGFVYALSVAQGWIATGVASRVLVIGAEAMSRIIDWSDRGTCILFGDGAGAVILEAQENTSRGILALKLEAAGEFGPLLGTNGGVSSTQTVGHLFMEGQEIFRHGVEKMANITLETLKKANLTLADVSWLVPHQANARMIRMIGRSLRISEEKCVVTVDIHANTSAATIPLALDVAVRDGRIKQGDIVAMPALGAGLTWGCCVICW